MIRSKRNRVVSMRHQTPPRGTPRSGPTARLTRAVSILRLLCAALLGAVVLASLSCGGDSPAPRDRGQDAGGGSAGRPLSGGNQSTASDRPPPSGTNYVPDVLGVKVFSARDEKDLEPYFSASGGRSVSADAMFDEAEAMFGRLPDGEPVFSRDTPVVVTVVMFDCRPAGNIRLEGTTRLIDETVPGDPFVTYERSFSIMRRQEGNGFTISTSSGRGCMDNLNAGAPSGGWAPGPYRVEYRDASGALLVAVPFEVTTTPSVTAAVANRLRDGGAGSDGSVPDASGRRERQMWIDVQLDRNRPGARIEVNSDRNIEPGDLLITIDLDNRGLLWGLDLYNSNRIPGGAGFVVMDFAAVDLLWQERTAWRDNRLTGVSAALRGNDLACRHDAGASDHRRQNPFDNRQVFSCRSDDEIIVVPPGVQTGGTPTPTPNNALDLLNIQR